MNKNIILLSLSASSSRYDFLVLKDELRRNNPDYSVHYFLGDREAKEKNQVRSMLYEAENLKNYDSDWIGLEGFLPDEFVTQDRHHQRYLLLEPFDILFRMKWNRKNCQQFLRGYTHVIVPSQYWADKIASYMGDSEIHLLRDIQLPFFEKAMNDAYKQTCRKELEVRYPDTIGKKILYINLTGQRANPERNDYTEMDMRRLLDALPEEWMIVTNSLNLRYASRHVEASYRKKFLYVPGGTMKQQLLVCAEGLLSNNAYSTSLFASTGRPFSMIQFSDNGFEKYMWKHNHHQMVTNCKQMAESIQRIVEGKQACQLFAELITTADQSFVQEIFEE